MTPNDTDPTAEPTTSDDAQGHRVTELIFEETDDAEGHRFAKAVPDETDDAEGHLTER